MLELDSTSRLIAEIAGVGARHPLAPKLLVCQTPAQGRELLRAKAAAGHPSIGWEVTSLRQLAHELVAADLARSGETRADDFDLLALTDAAIDAATARGAAGPFGGAAGAGYRDAIRRAIEQLRGAAIAPAAVAALHDGEDRKLGALAAILTAYERLLAEAGKVDGPAILARAAEAVEGGSAALPEAELFVLPGHPARGVAGRLVRALVSGAGARMLTGDAVLGLDVPAGLATPPRLEPAGPLSALHAPERSTERPALELFAAATPMDELREVLRRVVSRGISWDRVEIVTTDAVIYGAALDSIARRLEIPVTYSEGLDSRRTRVGRAVEAYLRWIGEGFPADLLRGMLESGDLAPPEGHDGVSAAALARRLRRLRVGWGQARYLEAIDGALRALEEAPVRQGEDGDPEAAREAREREARELTALRALLSALLAATPALPERGRGASGRTSPAAVARGALAFLELVPVGDVVENTTRKMVRDRLERAAAALTRETGPEAAIGILRAQLETRVAPGGEGGLAPWTSTPGRLHLSSLNTGGLACRPFTFVVGLDAGRTAGAVGTDPLLTESDRQPLNAAAGDPVPPLPGIAERIEEARFRLAGVLARLRGEITLSYAAWDMAEGRAVSPAPELLQALRLCEGDPELSYRDLRVRLGPLACAVPAGSGRVDAADVWLAALADGRVLRAGDRVVRSVHGGLDRGLHAAAERAGDAVTEYHGRIAPRPELDPRSDAGAVFSATRLETLGTCPRKFFYRYVLGVTPLRDPEWDAEAWLDALERGSLLHAVYEHALREARAAGVAYAEAGFAERALAALEREIGRTLARCPAPSQAVLDAEAAALGDDVLAWVAMIRRDQPEWTELELAFGPGAREVSIPVGAATVRVQGAIDRVERVAGGAVKVVDYKTGGADWYRPTRPFKGGRRIQHVLYTLAAERLLDAQVEAMEYHFPTRRGETRIVRYDRDALAAGEVVLETLFAIAADGHFVATDDPSDCRYCDFAPVCRAEVDDYGGVDCAIVGWARSTGAERPEYERLNWLRGIDA